MLEIHLRFAETKLLAAQRTARRVGVRQLRIECQRPHDQRFDLERKIVEAAT
jgi:hypothetical protein